ncbi:MAG: beta-lactamase family protein [bacterium]|nr:beta-lactamase family protein [bacterium]
MLRRGMLLQGLALFGALTAPAVSWLDGFEAEVDGLFQEFNRPDVPGAGIAVIRDGEVVLQKSYGLAHLGKKTRADEHTNYRLASVSKQFTAMAVLILRERGQLSFDDPLTKFFPDFPGIGKRIQVGHLLRHTSGIVAYEDIMPSDQAVQLKDRDVLELLKAQQGTYFTPGTEFRYSNSGYALLALIVEQVSGRDFATFLRENIFEPLGMKNTVAREKGVSQVANRAYGYKETEGGFVDADQSMTSAVLGDGGIYTSLADYRKWDRTLYEGKPWSRKMLAEAVAPGRLADGTAVAYGLGWRLSERAGMKVIHHNGRTSGFNTAVRRVPNKRLTVIIFVNRQGRHAGLLADQLLDRLLAE